MTALEFKNVSYKFPGGGVSGIDFTLSQGETAAIMGPLASGKTTLLRLARCELMPASGSVLINGHNSAEGVPTAMLKLGTPIEQEQVRAKMTAGELLLKAAAPYRGIDTQHLQFIKDSLGMNDISNTPISELSGGQLAMLMNATAFAGNPRLITLDNPFDSLNPDDIDRLIALITVYCKKKNAAALIATGNCELAERFCDKAVVLLGGRIMDKIDIEHINDSFKSQSYRYTFITDKPYSAAAVLQENGYSPSTDLNEVSAIFSRKQLNQVLIELIRNGISIFDVKSSRDSLRSRYTDALLFMGGYSGV